MKAGVGVLVGVTAVGLGGLVGGIAVDLAASAGGASVGLGALVGGTAVGLDAGWLAQPSCVVSAKSNASASLFMVPLL